VEHTLGVVQLCQSVAEQFVARYPDLQPPLNRSALFAAAVLHDLGRVLEFTDDDPPQLTRAGQLLGHINLARDLFLAAARAQPDLHADLIALVEHLILTHLRLPEWGSPRLPAVPEALILHHLDDLDAKFEMYARCLRRDTLPGEFTDRDPILGRVLWKRREV
jgi:3'-5' exoribonuclease